MTKVFSIGIKRHLFQWSMALLWFTIPFISVDGHSLVEIDLPNLALHLGAAVFRIEELHIFWLLTMASIFLFLFLTMVFGRIWCGWACPQTAFTDLAEWFGRRLGMKVENNHLTGKAWQQFILHLSYLALALLAGCSFVWYFVPPDQFFSRLLAADLGGWPLGTSLVIAAIVLLDLAFLRRLFCREFCPYGRFQTIIVHPGTLTLGSLPSEIDRCVDCKACVRTCPMGIDIRNGFQIECINCARCIDACRQVMTPRRQPGIIGYTFGNEGKGWRVLLAPRIIMIGIISLALMTGLFYSASHRSTFNLKLQRSTATAPRLLENDQVLTFFAGHFNNLSLLPEELSISATLENGEKLTVKGPSVITLQANEKRTARLGIITANPPESSDLQVFFSVYDQDHKVLARKAFITHTGKNQDDHKTDKNR